MIKLSVVCCVLFFGGLAVADNVPALIWGPFNHYTPAVALKSYNGIEFIDVLSEHIKPETIAFVFAEDQLSTEDLSQCRTTIGNTCFRGIQQVKTKLYLPNVEDPLPVVEDVAGPDRVDAILSSNGELSEPLNPDNGGKFYFVNFDDDATEETKASKLSRHDQLISKLSADLAAQNIDFVIIYTGKRAEHQKRVVRQAASPATSSTTSATTSATSTTTTAATSTTVRPKQLPAEGTFWKRPRLLMYYLGLQQIATDGTATDIEVASVTVGEIEGGRFKVSMVSGANTFAFNVSGESGYWWVNDFTWNDQAILSNTRIAAVDTFSFHCSPAIEIGTLNKATLIRWTGLQIQPELGTVADQVFESFGDSWDCVGFVSPGIVGGLFVVIMLLFILSIGISWMMDINTMDRFDDPKGKTITISVNE
jgi:V-type H+-transporting ATPase S1 subunit